MKLTGEDVKEQIYKLAKKGLSPSQIGSGCVIPATTFGKILCCPYRCHSEGLSWRGSSEAYYWQQDTENPQSQRYDCSTPWDVMLTGCVTFVD